MSLQDKIYLDPAFMHTEMIRQELITLPLNLERGRQLQRELQKRITDNFQCINFYMEELEKQLVHEHAKNSKFRTKDNIYNDFYPVSKESLEAFKRIQHELESIKIHLTYSS